MFQKLVIGPDKVWPIIKIELNKNGLSRVDTFQWPVAGLRHAGGRLHREPAAERQVGLADHLH